MAGLKNQIEGKAHEIKGRITHDESAQLAGKIQQKKGKLQSTLTRAKANVVTQTEAIIESLSS
ncbi:MAG: hypothetical protein HW416_593 [Chloroflexi bacterium]|nr:hypothetical protein [Chloroflexota bacterium]